MSATDLRMPQRSCHAHARRSLAYCTYIDTCHVIILYIYIYVYTAFAIGSLHVYIYIYVYTYLSVGSFDQIAQVPLQGVDHEGGECAFDGFVLRCAAPWFGDIFTVQDLHVQPNIVTINGVSAAFAKAGKWQKAHNLLTEAAGSGSAMQGVMKQLCDCYY